MGFSLPAAGDALARGPSRRSGVAPGVGDGDRRLRLPSGAGRSSAGHRLVELDARSRCRGAVEAHARRSARRRTRPVSRRAGPRPRAAPEVLGGEPAPRVEVVGQLVVDRQGAIGIAQGVERVEDHRPVAGLGAVGVVRPSRDRRRRRRRGRCVRESAASRMPAMA